MKRYNITSKAAPGIFQISNIKIWENDTGDWVAYKDVRCLLDVLTAATYVNNCVLYKADGNLDEAHQKLTEALAAYVRDIHS